MLCREGYRIDDTNASYGGIVCGACGETGVSGDDFTSDDWPEDDFDPVLDALADIELSAA